jgi:superfamily II DNA or RNA helicase
MSAEHKNINTLSSKMATKTPIKKRVKKPIPLSIAESEQPQPEIVFKTTKEKGDAYEIFIKHHLIDSGNYEWVYLWKHVPEAELFESGIMDDWNQSRIVRKVGRSEGLIGDIGTDLLIKAKDGKYSLVQCKHYNNENILRIEDLGTFYFMMMNYTQYVNGIVYYTSKLSKLLNDHSKKVNSNIKYNLEPFNTARYIELMNTIYKPLENINDSSNTKLTPRDYQLEAIGQLRAKQRTVCQLPCGMGKTLIAIKLAEQYNQVIVITPLKIYCEQNMERFKSQMPSEYFMMIIDSDNDGRNIDKIKKFIGDNEKICLFATFKSVDIVNKLISDKIVNNYYVIIDEFHNLSVSDILKDDLEDNLEEELLDEVNQDNGNSEDDLEDFEEDDLADSDDDIEEPENNQSEMYKLLHSDSRILFMSATPKLMGSDNDYSEDCDIDEEIFGNIDYKMDMRTAIERGGICDYMVYVPTLSIEKSTGLDKIQEEVDISKYDKELVIKARFIIRGMMNNGSRKCIVYLQTQEECRVMNTILADVGTNYFAVNVNSNYIISDSSREERKAIIKSFTDGEGYSFLCNVNILNECIDVPECDSIFIAYPSKSKIRNIQRMCRANRKDKKNLNKIARIYIWADEYKDELVDFISHLKEYDNKFTFDKVKRLNVIGNKTAAMKSSDAVEENKKLEDIVVGVKDITIFDEKYKYIDTFIEINNKRPNKRSSDPIEKNHGKWLCNIFKKYYSRSLNKYKYEKIGTLLTKYNKILISQIDSYKQYLDKIIYIYEHENRLPSSKTELNLRRWYVYNMKRVLNNEFIFNKELTEKITGFVLKTKHLYNKDNIWINKFNESYNLLKKLGKRPSGKFGNWITKQLGKYRNNKLNDYKKLKIEKMINDYKHCFMDNEDIWNIIYDELETFIIKNNRRPKLSNKNEKFYINWINTQNRKIKNNSGIMKKNIYKNKFILLKQKHGILLLNNSEKWYYRLNILDNLINSINTRPTISNCSKDVFAYYTSQVWDYRHYIGNMKKKQNGQNSEYYIAFTNVLNKYPHIQLI